MSAEESHHHAARCLHLAQQTPSAKLKDNLLAQAQAWTRLAEEQERTEERAAQRELRANLLARWRGLQDGAPFFYTVTDGP